ncbi:hypothetical protein ACFYVL_02120 [Streptomyces sp. NPDC004111]|uniref:hypothetical protein n=1 Tax=Streptomyces sp. NPDC004111 TaxID=3364690 RepID=UPI0036D09586
MPVGVVLGLAFLAAAVAAAAVFATAWGLLGAQGLKAEPRIDSKTLFDLVKFSFGVVAGAGALVALVVAYRRQRVDEEGAHRESTRLHTERFSQAVDKLGSDSPAVRLGGIHALAGLADDAPTRELRQTCIDVLCAYLRLSARPAPNDLPDTWPDGTPPTEEQREAHQEKKDRYAALREARHTIFRLICAHYRVPLGAHGSWQGCGLDLTGVVVDTDLDFTGATFADGTVNFTGATFRDSAVRLAGATFSGGNVHFDAAAFEGGSLHFDDASFSGGRVSFDTAKLSTGAVSFAAARFSGGRLSFHSTELSSGSVYFSGAKLSGGSVTFHRSKLFGGSLCFDAVSLLRGSRLSFDAATFSGCVVSFAATRFSGGDVHFNDARITAGSAYFDGAQFSGSFVSFADSKFCGGTVDFGTAAFTGGTVTFDDATFSVGRVDFGQVSGAVPDGLLDAVSAPWARRVVLPAHWAPSTA